MTIKENRKSKIENDFKEDLDSRRCGRSLLAIA